MNKIFIKLSALGLKKAEWVCVGFLVFAFLRIITSSVPMDWGAIRWNSFPRLDILYIAISVWILKLSRKNRFYGVCVLLLLILSFYGNTGYMDEPFIPVRKFLGPTSMLYLEKVRYVLLLFVLAAISFMGYKNTSLIREAVSKTRVIIPFFLIVYLYPFVPLIIHTGHPSGLQDFDLIMAKIDSWMFLGNNPTLILETWINPFLSEFMAFVYSTYGVLFAIIFGFLYLKHEDQPAEEMIFLSTLTLAMGYASFTFFPVKGPMFMQKFSVPLDLYYMKEFKKLYMDQPRIDRDCFPSLHTAVSMILLYCSWRFIRPLFWPALAIVIFIPFACVYLRYHYVVDVIAGILLAIFVILFSMKIDLMLKKEPRI
jgi:membrane-associated phospholipid phosphatase